MQKLKIPRYIQWLIITGFIFLVLMTLLRLTLVLTFHHTLSLKTLFSAFVLGLRYDLRMVAVACMVIFLLGSFKFLHPFQTRLGSAVSFFVWTLFIVAFSFFYILDFAHYSYLSQRLNGSVLNYVDDVKISMKMVWQTYPVILIIILLITSVLLLLGMVRLVYNYILSKPILSVKKSRITWSIVFFLLLAVAIFGRVGQFPLRWSDAFSLGDDLKAQISLNPFQSFVSSLKSRHTTYDVRKVKQHYMWMAAHLQVDHPDSLKFNFERRVVADSTRPAAQRPNVVLVICESFSAYKSSMISNPLNTTPFFKKMSQNGVYFDRCFTPAYGTARGVWAVITGIPDVDLNNTSSRNPAAVNQHTIINNFKGYEKFYFLGGSASWANIRGLLTNNIKGLHLYEEDDYNAAKIDVWGISDKNLFLEANKILGAQTKPFFAVIQTADNHRPYTIPKEDLNIFKKNRVAPDTLGKYGFASEDEYNAFRYTDFGYEQFMGAARKEKYFDNTVFVFVGDHGIKGVAGNMLPKIFSDQSMTSEHVPLLFYAPSLLKPARYNFPVSQLDVLPTIGGLVKIPYRNNSLGRDLLSAATPGIENLAFIIDIDVRRIGVVSDKYYYSYNVNGQAEQIASIIDNSPVRLTDSLRQKYKNITDAYYETSRYLILNNKKKPL